MIILIGSLNTNIWQKRKTITMYPSLISVYSQTMVRALVSITLRRISLSTNLLSKIRHACRRRCLGYTYLLLRDEWTDENLNRPYECLYNLDYKFWEVYLLTTAAEDEEFVPRCAEAGLFGWIDCYPKARLAGTLFCGGVNKPNEIKGNAKLKEAFDLGKSV